MDILIVSDSLVTGGAETFALRLARSFIRRGHRCDVINLNPDFEDGRLVGQYPDVNILRIPLRGLRTLKRLDRAGRALGLDLRLQARSACRWLRRNLCHYDIYHTHLFAADRVIAGLADGDPSIRIVSTQHGDYAKYLSNSGGTETLRIRAFARKVEAIEPAIARFVTISDAQTALLEDELRVPPAKLVKIVNGFEPSAAFEPRPRADPRFCIAMAARGIEEKGWRHLVDAFRATDIDGRLLLIGEGPFLNQMKAEAMGDRRIEFAGFHPRPVELIRDADLFVHPSIHPSESLPTVIIEALYCGVPVVATDVGEVGNMLRTKRGGLAGTLLRQDPATLTEDLRATLDRYANNRDLLALHAGRTKDAFEKFAMERCVDVYLDLFEAVTSAPARSPTS